MVSENDTDTVFLRPFLNILLSEFLIYMLIHTKFLLSRKNANLTDTACRVPTAWFVILKPVLK